MQPTRDVQSASLEAIETTDGERLHAVRSLDFEGHKSWFLEICLSAHAIA